MANVRVGEVVSGLTIPISAAVISASVLVAVSGSARADAVSDFYTGKTVNLVIGYAPGGGYDLYARTLGRHIGGPWPIISARSWTSG